jgi:hypothetical protein
MLCFYEKSKLRFCYLKASLLGSILLRVWTLKNFTGADFGTAPHPISPFFAEREVIGKKMRMGE